MDSTDLKKLAERPSAVAHKVRTERRDLANHRRALDRPEVLLHLTPAARHAAAQQRRQQARDALKADVAAVLDAYQAADAARAAFSRDAWLQRARFYVPPGTEWSTDLRAAPDMQTELAERLLRREISDEVKTLTIDDLQQRLAALGGNERGAAELSLLERELRGRDAKTQATLAHARHAAHERIELPPQFVAAQGALRDLDVNAGVLDANWRALEDGTDQPAARHEAAFRILIENSRFASLSPTDPAALMSDEQRAKYEAFRDSERAKDDAATRKIAAELVMTAARAGIVAPAAATAASANP